MEFHEKLQSLRKQKGLTQEELAQALYVSRTAVSKWESGRGYPNLESLKAIAKFFGLTVDELLTIAEEQQRTKDQQQKQHDHCRDNDRQLVAACGLLSSCRFSFHAETPFYFLAASHFPLPCGTAINYEHLAQEKCL